MRPSLLLLFFANIYVSHLLLISDLHFFLEMDILKPELCRSAHDIKSVYHPQNPLSHV